MPRREKLSPLVHDGRSAVQLFQCKNDLAQQGRLAAVRFTDHQHPNKMPLQKLPEFLRENGRNHACDAEIQ